MQNEAIRSFVGLASSQKLKAMACNKNIVKLNLEVASSSPLLKVIVWARQYRISRGNGADENPPSSTDNGMMDPRSRSHRRD